MSTEKMSEQPPLLGETDQPQDGGGDENGGRAQESKAEGSKPMDRLVPTTAESAGRKLSDPIKPKHRKTSIIKPPSQFEYNEGGRVYAGRKMSEGNIHANRSRKISFITMDALLPQKEDRGSEDGDPGGYLGLQDVDEEGGLGSKTDSHPFLQVVLGRKESVANIASRESRASLSVGGGNLTSRPSMASLKETISRVNLELYPEKGSYVAFSMGQSMASIPTIAAKVYIITQILAAVSVSIGSMAVGFTAGWTSPALQSMNQENSTLTLTENQASWVGSLMPLSALTGSIIGGYLLDVLGRKMLICLCGIPFIIAYIIMGAATNVWMLYVGRSIAGLCVGFLTLSLPVYLSETIQAEIRGTLGILPTTLGNGGILVCYFLGAYVNWSVLAYCGAVIPAVFLVLMIFVPETPRWYISKDREEDAYKSLCWLRGTNADVNAELQDIAVTFDISAQQSSSMKDIFSRRYLKPFLICVTLMLFQQFSGINAVIFYANSIFESVGSNIDSDVCSVIIGLVNLFSTIVATVLIDRLGRKVLLYISDALLVISLISLTIFFYLQSLIVDKNDPEDPWAATVQSLSWLPLVNLMLYVIGFSLGWGPIPWLFMGEALPLKIRGPAASIVTACNWSCTFVITKVFPIVLAAVGEVTVFSFFTVVMIFGTLFTIFIVPETKGMSLEDIEASMMGRTKPSINRKMSEISGIVMT